jgi:hypothetical protein
MVVMGNEVDVEIVDVEVVVEVVNVRWRKSSTQLTMNTSGRSAARLGWKTTRCESWEQSHG